MKVLQIISRDDPGHVSAEDVHRALAEAGDRVGLATVYRVLAQLESAGLVERHSFIDGRRVYEPEPEQRHDHMVDVESGQIIEFVNHRIEALQCQVFQEHGFDLFHHEMVLYVRRPSA